LARHLLTLLPLYVYISSVCVCNILCIYICVSNKILLNERLELGSLKPYSGHPITSSQHFSRTINLLPASPIRLESTLYIFLNRHYLAAGLRRTAFASFLHFSFHFIVQIIWWHIFVRLRRHIIVRLRGWLTARLWWDLGLSVSDLLRDSGPRVRVSEFGDLVLLPPDFIDLRLLCQLLNIDSQIG